MEMNQERYTTLVRMAWDEYQKGNPAEMAKLLQDSLEYTPYLRVETISDWVSTFTRYAEESQREFDVESVSNLLNWNDILFAQRASRTNSLQAEKYKANGNLVKQCLTKREVIKEISAILVHEGFHVAERWVESTLESKLMNEFDLFKIFFSLSKDQFTKQSIVYGYKALSLKSDDSNLEKVLTKRVNQINDSSYIDKLEKTYKINLKRTIGKDEFDSEEFTANLQDVIKSEKCIDLHILKDQTLASKQVDEFTLNNLIFSQIRHSHPEQAIEFGEKAFELNKDKGLAKRLSDSYIRIGNLYRAYELREFYIEKTKGKFNSNNLRGQILLLEKGFNLPKRNYQQSHKNYNQNIVFYLLHNSIPYDSGGYATRAHGLSTAVNKQGFRLEAVTRLGYPFDKKDIKFEDIPECDNVDSTINYHRLLTPTDGLGRKPLPQYLEKYGQALLDLANIHQPAIIHGASNYMNGVAANYVGRILGLPSIYEVRGLWEITRISRQPIYKDSEHFRMMKRMETEAAANATAVITITGALRDEMVRRGIPKDRITVIHNGVDSNRFKPIERDEILENKFGYQGKVIIGYVGSIVQYEGLEYVLQAAALLKSRGLKNFALLIVGDGDCLNILKQLCDKLNLNDIVTFTGRVPHHEVERYYSLIDITPYPRKGQPVCEMVSPMKPFESMSMEKCVVASDVAALKEIVNDGVTGLLHRKDDCEDLAKVLETAIRNTEFRTLLGKQARKWVKLERDWKCLSGKLIELYKELTL